jgi:predicted negative regulator of RcsB-dependent stress response
MSETVLDDGFVRSLKDFWNRFGNILLTIVLICAIIFAGWRFWNNYQQKKVMEASSSYQILLSDYQVPTIQKEGVIAKGNAIMTNYPETIYANFSALLLATVYVSENNLDAARTSLEWVLSHTDNTVIQTIAKERLARIMIAQKEYQQAIDLLNNAVVNKSFDASVNIVLGNAYMGLENTSAAKEAWTKALTGLTSKEDEVMKNLITMKINNLDLTEK